MTMKNHISTATAEPGKPLSQLVFMLVGIVVLLASGCASIGADTMVRDRFDYNSAIAESWKKQMLLNMVKIRYGDVPIFLDVASVINQYALEGTVNLGASWLTDPSSTSQNIGAQGKYTDRPTITYNPLTGKKFARSLMRPIPPLVILSMIQAGYPADQVMRVGVQSINGIQNRFGGAARAQLGDPEFYPLLQAMREIQKSGLIGLRLKKIDKYETTMMVLRSKGAEKLEKELAMVRRILGLKAQENEYRVVYGTVAAQEGEIAMQTRSMLEIITDLSSFIDVPQVHVDENRVNPTLQTDNIGGVTVEPLMHIHSAVKRPDDAFVAMSYRDTWFWIDDRDLESKRLFSYLMFLFTLTETEEGREGAPIVTIPTG